MNDITGTVAGEGRPNKRSKTAKAKGVKEEGLEREDKRKYNRGLNQRRSYLKEEKIFVMLMKDSSKSADEISNLTGVSKSNVEKWCSDRVREKTLLKFRQEVKHPVVEELLKENPRHFSTKEPAKFKILLEVLAERLHLAQNHHQAQAGTYTIPPSIFWNFSAQPILDKTTGKKQFQSIYSTDSALQYVLNQGYFFRKKQDKDSATVTTNDKDDSISKEEEELHSYSVPLHLNYSNANSTNTLHYPPVSISQPNPFGLQSDFSRQQVGQGNTFISSEESDMMDFILDDQSIASSQWVPLPSDLPRSNGPNPISFPSSSVLLGESAVPVTGESSYQGDDDCDDSDDDLDCDEINDLLLASDQGPDTARQMSLVNKTEDLSEVLIRQGVVPALKPNKVCSKPVECRLELMRLLRDDCQGSSTRFVKSDCTMQFRGKIDCKVAVDESLPSQVVQVSMNMPLHATRGVLRNTKYLSAIRDSLNGKVLTEEEEEDAAVLSLLGE